MACTVQNQDGKSVKQGVYGNVTWLSGNMMPSPDEPRAMEGRPVERQINIYKVVTFNQVQGNAPLFKAIEGKLVKSVKSNAKGFYQCDLDPGVYSVFVLEKNGELFANISNGRGQINPITVQSGNSTKLDIQINYEAAY
ncbi:MAG: hypothetical protein REI64_02315 [Pedobacter sp.]|uniref:hypothetical protein n=1 Tax=Pedobacter sp. TaxID=1411316 RepID=UPI002807350F|nr:hypothetical protein [Pedobacter sp.]MDQ8003602.1 hypothetical protein [Pedobacter sp.]